MKKLVTSLLILGAVSLSGCGDKEAREYAARLIPVLDSYQEQLSQKIKAEQESYMELADTYEEARKKDIEIRLANDRKRRSEDQGEKTAGAKDAPTLSQLLTSLQDYGKSDFETTQTLLQEGLDSRSKHLADLESIEIELQKIKLLKQALKELSKSKSDFRKFKEATDLLLSTDEGVNTFLCVDLKKQLAELVAAKAAAAPDKKKEIEKKITQLNERITTKKCS
jgi:outer membrane murein-binding lipoprotein Lpp